MLDTFALATSRDFRARYAGSYGFYTNENAKKTFVQMVDIGEDVATFQDEDGATYRVNADVGVVFEFISAKKRLFEIGSTLKYIRRKTARQWSRGINTSNTQLSVLGSGRELPLSFEAMVAAMDTAPINALQNVMDLEQKKKSIALLSEMFGVVNSTLYLYDKPIATFLADRREILVDEPLFRQEIQDLITKGGLPYQVITK